MYPRTLLDSDVKSDGEKKVFAALRDGLDDSWEAFHSAGWVNRDDAEGAKDGEIDFVLVHPEQPILCLEVKGGGIECQHGEWFRLEDGKRERTRDPFAQAVDHTHDLRRKIAKVPGWKKHKLLIGHGLVFPDITVHELVLAPDAPPELIIDRNDLKEPDEAVAKLIAYHAGSREKRELPGDEEAEMLRELLAPDVRIEVPMATHILDEEEAIVTLTSDQARLLKAHAGNRRMLVRGCAGSGKTMLGVEMAKRFAKQGRRVLFVCFNRALRDHLRSLKLDADIYFQNFHALCLQLAKQAEVELPEFEGEAPESFWREDLPAALMEAAETLESKWSALIVDEAQDLHADWLEALYTVLDDPEDDPVWLFMDDNQDVYEVKGEIPREFHRYDLGVNCRNTQAIAREVHKKYRGEVVPEMLGPKGRDVELIQTDDQPAAVAAVLERICSKEEVAPQDVVVLSSHGIDNSEVAKSGGGQFTFSKAPPALGNHVRFSSIRGFKGLESPVVVLCELEGIEDATLDQQLYVGISRAKNHCVIVAPPRRSRAKAGSKRGD